MGGLDLGAGDRPPILDKIIRKLPPHTSTLECVARKYNCGSVWCPVCYKRFHLARHFARLSEMPWKETRLVTLTLDREVTGEAADAYVLMREKKAIGRFFVTLERMGVEFHDWAGQIEWHRDGTPHWHLLVWTKGGKMIGGDRIRAAWPWGKIVQEEYFKTQAHYDKTVGYFGKAGYFHKGKKHQTILPDYFRSEYFRGKRIARFYSARRPSGQTQEPEPAKSEPQASSTITGRKLKTCGQSTLIYGYVNDVHGFQSDQLWFCDRLMVPYKDIVDLLPGSYEAGVGYNVWLSGSPPPVDAMPF